MLKDHLEDVSLRLRQIRFVVDNVGSGRKRKAVLSMEQKACVISFKVLPPNL